MIHLDLSKKFINNVLFKNFMIITVSGKAGSGKSTVAGVLAKKLRLKHHSIGDLMRKIAKEKGMSLIEMGKRAEKDKKIDKELDRKQIELGKKGKNFVIDGRLTAFFIPKADLKIFLDCDDKVRAERILKEQRKDEKTKNLGQAVKSIKEREESERKRYKKYYKVDYFNKELYDFVIDTTFTKVNEVVDDISGVIKKKK